MSTRSTCARRRASTSTTRDRSASPSLTAADTTGELMGIAGNYQISPDAYRERGYAGYLEWSPASGYAVGVEHPRHVCRAGRLPAGGEPAAGARLTRHASPGSRWSCRRIGTFPRLQLGLLGRVCGDVAGRRRALAGPAAWARARPIILVSRSGPDLMPCCGAALPGFSHFARRRALRLVGARRGYVHLRRHGFDEKRHLRDPTSRLSLTMRRRVNWIRTMRRAARWGCLCSRRQRSRDRRFRRRQDRPPKPNPRLRLPA